MTKFMKRPHNLDFHLKGCISDKNFTKILRKFTKGNEHFMKMQKVHIYSFPSFLPPHISPVILSITINFYEKIRKKDFYKKNKKNFYIKKSRHYP